MPAKPTEDHKQRFLRDISRHTIKVIREDGVYRHIRCSRPGSWDMHFDIITWPGYLAYVGDMGAFTFTRLHDMLEYFRNRRGILRINPQYWAEKLVATDCNGEHCQHGAAEWSDDRFKAAIKEHFEDHFANLQPDEDATNEERASFEFMKADAWEQVEDEIFIWDSDLEHAGYQAANEFKHEPSKLEFEDLFECRLTEYSMRFMWACHAIAWAVLKYDQIHTNPADQRLVWACDATGRAA